MSAPLVLALRLMLAITLYTFLGWILYTLWQELQQHGKQLSARAVPAINLSVKVGETVIQHNFRKSKITLGRDSGCDLIVNDDTVSARHASLAYHHGQWWLEDLGSTNGVIVNQERLAVPIVVISGDHFQCGEAEVAIHIETDQNSPII